MSEPYLGSRPLDHASDDAILPEPRGLAQPRRRATDKIDAGTMTRFEAAQLAREYAEIERATAALRIGEPELQSWIKPSAPPTAVKPRPLWLLIGVLWLSTALVTAGAIAAIATLAG
jgi:hypothetical protein